MSITVGVIGAGNMGGDHALTLHRFVSGAVVGMVADVDRGRAQAVCAQLPGARATADPLALIADPAVDAIVIASHDSTHEELALACVAARKPVLCEKPLAPEVAGCERVVAAERAAVGAGAPLVSLGFMRRFDPGYTELKAALDGGAIGNALLVHCFSRGVVSGPGSTDESSVTNSAVHEFDVLPWLLDSPISEVSWHAGRPSGGADGFSDPQVMLLRTRSGVLATLETFLNAGYGYDVRCEVVGERGTLSLAGHGAVIGDGAGQRSSRYAPDWRGHFAQAYRLELQAWIDALAIGAASALASAQDGLRAMVVADAVIASMHGGGRPVAVDQAAV